MVSKHHKLDKRNYLADPNSSAAATNASTAREVFMAAARRVETMVDLLLTARKPSTFVLPWQTPHSIVSLRNSSQESSLS